VSAWWVRQCLRGAALLAVITHTLPAQGAVRGQVGLKERPGETTEDLVNTVVYLEPRGSTPSRLPATPATMILQGRQFAPQVRVVTQGSRVSFPNQDPFSHNVFSKAEQGPFDTQSYGRGRSRDNLFAEAGIYPLYCNVHPRMTAYVIALRTPYFTQAGQDGRFAIEDVPAGTYRLHVWHPRAADVVTADLIVPAAGLQAPRYELDASGYRFVQHRNKFGQDYPRGADRY
jgi:hypothetical protein